MISLLVTIAVVGLIVWAITLIPMPQAFKTAIIVIAIICVVLYVLQVLGLWGGSAMHDIPVPRLR